MFSIVKFLTSEFGAGRGLSPSSLPPHLTAHTAHVAICSYDLFSLSKHAFAETPLLHSRSDDREIREMYRNRADRRMRRETGRKKKENLPFPPQRPREGGTQGQRKGRGTEVGGGDGTVGGRWGDRSGAPDPPAGCETPQHLV